MSKYIKLKSVTWWASIIPLLAGVFIAFDPVHELHTYTQAVSSLFGGVPASVLISNGLIGIGLRGAIGT